MNEKDRWPPADKGTDNEEQVLVVRAEDSFFPVTSILDYKELLESDADEEIATLAENLINEIIKDELFMDPETLDDALDDFNEKASDLILNEISPPGEWMDLPSYCEED